jgi:GDSL-like Lipase/Acylhydrolase family
LKIKKALLASLLIIASVCICLLMLEVGVRLFVDKSKWEFWWPSEDWQVDPLLGWVQRPDLDLTMRTVYGWTVHFRTNEDGLTPPSAKRVRTPGRKRIMIFGDSTVVGRLVPQDQTITAQLEHLLRDRGINAEVINAGVQGYATDQALLRMEQLLPIYKPDIAMYCLCDNDFRGNALNFTNSSSKPRFKLTKDGTLTMSPPQFQEKINWGNTTWTIWIHYSALFKFLSPEITVVRIKLGRWGDRKLYSCFEEIYHRPEALNQIDWSLFRALVVKMKQVSTENGVRFLFYSHPSLNEVWLPYVRASEKDLGLKPNEYDKFALEKRLKKLAAENGIVYVPLINYFLMRQSQGPFHLVPRDPHCNQAGYRLTAEVLAGHCSSLFERN